MATTLRPHRALPHPLGWRAFVVLVLGGLACGACAYQPPPSPTVHQGRAYAGAWDRIYGVDLATGAPSSETALPDGSPGSLVIHEGVAYGLRGDEVVGVRLLDGAEVMRGESPAGRFSARLLHGASSLVALAASGGDYDTEHLVAFDLEGAIRWKAALDTDRSWRTAAEGPHLGAGLIVVPAGNDVVAIDPYSGRLLWSQGQSAPVLEVVAMGRSVAALREDDRLVVLDAETGKRRWEDTVEGASETGPGSWWRAPRLAASQDAIVVRRGGRLVAYDPETQQLRWTSADEVAAAVVDERQALVALDDERIALVDLTTGGSRWTIEADLCIDPVLSEQGGVALLMPDYDELMAVELADGTQRWRLDLDDGVQVYHAAAGRVWLGAALAAR